MKSRNGSLRVLVARNGIWLALILLAAVFTILNPRFIQPSNLLVILGQIAELGIVVLPVAFVVMLGGIDLSVGAVMSGASILAGLTMNATGSGWLGVLVGLVFGAVAGALNGFLIAYLRFNPFVVTLGFVSVWGGLALLLNNGKTISGLPHDFLDVFGLKLGGQLPVSVLVLVVAVAAAWWILNHTAKGRQVLAIGGNARAAHLMGVRVERTKFWVYCISGVCAALAALLLGAKLAAFTPTVGSGQELTVLTMVLLGGVALEGGSGRIAGVVAGVLFIGALQDGLIILGVSAYVKTMLIGVMLILAIALDTSVQRIVRSAWRRLGARSAEAVAAADGELRASAAAVPWVAGGVRAGDRDPSGPAADAGLRGGAASSGDAAPSADAPPTDDATPRGTDAE